MHSDAILRFESERLSLRPLAIGDEPALGRILRDPKVVFWRSRPVSWPEIRGRIEHSAGLNRRGLGWWLVFERAGGRLAGDVVLQPLPGTFEVELGYHFLPEFQRRGHATEAGARLLRHAFATLALTRVRAVILPRNRPSLRVAAKLGFVQRGACLHAGLYHRYFRLDRSEFFMRQSSRK